MPIALKEWAVTVRALAEGEQLVALRKGGIREDDKHFEVEHDQFFLYPTFDHQRNDLVRESHHPELRRALEEGVWPDEEPPPKALLQDGGIPQPDRVRLRAWGHARHEPPVEEGDGSPGGAGRFRSLGGEDRAMEQEGEDRGDGGEWGFHEADVIVAAPGMGNPRRMFRSYLP